MDQHGISSWPMLVCWSDVSVAVEIVWDAARPDVGRVGVTNYQHDGFAGVTRYQCDGFAGVTSHQHDGLASVTGWLCHAGICWMF